MSRSQAELLKDRDLPIGIATSIMFYVEDLFSRPPQNKKKSHCYYWCFTENHRGLRTSVVLGCRVRM